MNDADRFWAHVAKGAADACWEWQRSQNPSGHGRYAVPGSRVVGLEHRHAWELSVGPIPDGLCVLHKCDNPPCCNPAHLFLGTRADNVRDMDEKGRSRRLNHMAERQLAKTQCPAGHPYSAENTLTRKRGGRECRTCVYARNERNRLTRMPERIPQGQTTTVPQVSENTNTPEGALEGAE